MLLPPGLLELGLIKVESEVARVRLPLSWK
jgi:hypothetical protein